MIYKLAEIPTVASLIGLFIFLSTAQFFIPEYHFTTIGLSMFCVVFAFKSWINFSSAYTMYRQHGTSDLAVRCQSYFWAALGMSVAFFILFGLAVLDRASIDMPWLTAGVRNTFRNITITAVTAVIIYGTRMLDALFTSLRANALNNRTQGEVPQ